MMKYVLQQRCRTTRSCRQKTLPIKQRAGINGKRLSIDPQGRLWPPAASKIVHCRIVMAEGRRPDDQPMCGVWSKIEEGVV